MPSWGENSRLRQLLAGVLLLPVSSCSMQLTPGSATATQVMEMKDVMECLHLGNTHAGIDENNSQITVTEGGYEIDKNLLASVRSLANEIGADAVVPIYEDDNLIMGFRLYVCRARAARSG